MWHRSVAPVEPVVTVRIHHPNGITLTAPSTQTSQFPLGEVSPGVAHLDLIIDRMPLMPGDYALSFEIRDPTQTHVFDAWDHAEILRVQPGTSPEREGLLDIAPRWEVGSA